MSSLEVLVILIILALRKGLGVSSELSENGNPKSICRQYHRINATQQVSYVETYHKSQWNSWDGTYEYVLATRTNFKTETVLKWKVVETCCEGYMPHELAEGAEECAPICHSGCENGNCHLPNVCTCDPGYNVSMNETTGYSECSPFCASGCVGGQCVAPDVCACEGGYNSANNGSSCEPDCTSVRAGEPEQTCGDYATCIAPDTCQCHDGYGLISLYDYVGGESWLTKNIGKGNETLFHTGDILCVPVCEPKCSANAICVAPNDCKCTHGYREERLTNETHSVSQCTPICEKTCINGFCAAPSQCQCHEGYKPHVHLGQEYCEPVCQDDCVNGKCTSPNHCECLNGYEKLVVKNGNSSEISPNVCIPVCPGSCLNGNCIAPGQCHCNDGYASTYSKPDGTTENRPRNIIASGSDWWVLNIDKSMETCQPICEAPCDNRSICVAPNLCQLRPTHNFRVRIAHSPEDCGNDGVFYHENGSCACNYRSICTEPSLCAVLIADDLALNGKFDALQRVGFWIYANTSIIYPWGNEATKYYIPARCQDECRISIVSNENREDFRASIETCFQLEIYNATTAILSTDASPLNHAKSNDSLFCFINERFPCNGTKLGNVERRVSGVIAGVVGSMILFAVLVAIGVLIYLTRRRICNIGLFKGSSRREGVMDRSEARDSPFQVDDSSHL